MIERIEIITNPGAEYAPESNAIVNIKLKTMSPTFGSSINLKIGTFENYGGSILYGAEIKKWDFYINTYYYKYGQRLLYNMNLVTPTDSTRVDDSRVVNIDNPAFIRMGVIHNFDKNAILGMEGEAGRYIFSTESGMHYSASDNNLFYTPLDEKWASKVFNVSLDFSKKFDENNALKVVSYFGRLESEKELNDPQIQNDVLVGGTRTIGNGNGLSSRFDLQYEGGAEQMQYKTGYRFDLEDANSATSVKFYGDTAYQSRLTYKKSAHSIFVELKRNFSKFGYSMGLRAEYVERKVDTVYFKSINIFPSLGIIFNLGDFKTMNLSYSHRIERPDAYSLNPVKVWILPNEAHVGNPTLKPQHNHSLELNFETPLKNNISFSLMLAYIFKQNYICTSQEADSAGIVLWREVNLSHRSDFGGNITLNWALYKFVDLNFSPNLWLYKFTKQDGTEVKNVRYEFPISVQVKTPVGYAQVFVLYTGPHEEANTQYSSSFNTQIAFMTQISNFIITFGFLDAFHTYKSHTISNFYDGFREIEFRPDYPTIFVDVTYAKKEVRKLKTEEGNYERKIKGL